MKIITIVGPDTANGRKYSTDILALYNELDKSEKESYRKETGINVRFTPAKSLAERFRGRLLAVVNAGNAAAKSLYDKAGFKVGAYQMYWRV